MPAVSHEAQVDGCACDTLPFQRGHDCGIKMRILPHVGFSDEDDQGLL